MKKCYFCGKVVTGDEHALPRMMFREFDCDSITVPSCDVCNNEKSGRDQAIVHGFLKSLNGYKKSLSGNVQKAFYIMEKSFNYTK
jgi:DNA polymerase III alpha subunit (gram-positive type)